MFENDEFHSMWLISQFEKWISSYCRVRALRQESDQVQCQWQEIWTAAGGFAEATRSLYRNRLVVTLFLILDRHFSPKLQELDLDRFRTNVLTDHYHSSLWWPSLLTPTWEHASFSFLQFSPSSYHSMAGFFLGFRYSVH